MPPAISQVRDLLRHRLRQAMAAMEDAVPGSRRCRRGGRVASSEGQRSVAHSSSRKASTGRILRTRSAGIHAANSVPANIIKGACMKTSVRSAGYMRVGSMICSASSCTLSSKLATSDADVAERHDHGHAQCDADDAPSAHTQTASMVNTPTMAFGFMPMASSMPNSRVRSKAVMMKALTTDRVTRIINSQYIIEPMMRSSSMACSSSGRESVPIYQSHARRQERGDAGSDLGNAPDVCGFDRYAMHGIAERKGGLHGGQVCLQHAAVEFRRTGLEDAVYAEHQRGNAAVLRGPECHDFVA